MGKWQVAGEAALRAFDDMTAGLENTEPRKMFGYACVFANGYLCIGTHGVGIVLRLPEVERMAFVRQYAAEIFTPMAGRPMREYVVVPVALYTKKAVLRKWARCSVDYVCSLPAKPAKAAKTKVVSVANSPVRRVRAATKSATR